MGSSKILRDYLRTPGKMVVAPGAYDGISARMIKSAGFEAIYMTGGGTSASRIGQPDLGLTTLTEMVTNAAAIVECSGLPVIADADTGYGNALSVIRTVREYERAGVAGIHLEDQVFPKRCGYLKGKQVIPAQEFVQKIKAAVDSRRDADFLIIARSDARAVYGFEEAIDRANLYIEAGADLFFVEAPQSVEEFDQTPKRVKGPCLINMVGPLDGTRVLTIDEVKRTGYKIAIYPAICFHAAVHAFRERLKALKEDGIGWDPSNPVNPYELFMAMGLGEWTALEAKYSEKG
jgi:2-methylisocitrate lyase-like PEP mutase family enzyme